MNTMEVIGIILIIAGIILASVEMYIPGSSAASGKLRWMWLPGL